MKVSGSRFAIVQLASLATIAVFSIALVAPVHGERRVPARGGDPEAVEVELFSAMESGDIEVQVFAKDAKQANVLVKNKTEKPLRIALPEAFAAVPVLAQFGGGGGFGGGGMGGGGMGGMGGGGMGGGGMGGMGGGGGFGGGGGGFFNVGPEKTGKIRVTTVCLEHGKDDPNPRIPYTLVPLNKFKDDPKVYEVCAMLGRGEIDQASAQAAAWHFTDEMTFQELAMKIGIKHLNGATTPFFATHQVVRGAHIAHEAERRAQLRSPHENSKAPSLSQR